MNRTGVVLAALFAHPVPGAAECGPAAKYHKHAASARTRRCCSTTTEGEKVGALRDEVVPCKGRGATDANDPVG